MKESDIVYQISVVTYEGSTSLCGSLLDYCWCSSEFFRLEYDEFCNPVFHFMFSFILYTVIYSTHDQHGYCISD
jgi:hypothetical protein